MKNLKLNSILQTKDGRKIGNAIVIKVNENNFLIKTDYGNEVLLNEKEIDELFYLAFYSEYNMSYDEFLDYITSNHKHKV